MQLDEVCCLIFPCGFDCMHMIVKVLPWTIYTVEISVFTYLSRNL